MVYKEIKLICRSECNIQMIIHVHYLIIHSLFLVLCMYKNLIKLITCSRSNVDFPFLTKLYAVAEPSMPAPTTMTSNTSLLPSMTTVNCYNSVIDEQNRNRCMQWRDNDRQHYYSYFRCVLVNFLN